MGATLHLSQQFDALGPPADASAWLLDLYRAIQVIDDAADGDKADRAEVEDAAMAIFVRMPLNPFWHANMHALLPVLTLAVIKWRAANEAEADGKADERSFMWRAGYYDVVALVAHLCGRPATAALWGYGETFAAYREEFHA